MDGIPPARDSDVEDVVWALQTAEALWKRNERGDAVVWLRRAAQAAGEANDDDRALKLARDAAELTEVLSAHAHPASEPISEGGGEIDTLLRTSQVDPAELVAPAFAGTAPREAFDDVPQRISIAVDEADIEDVDPVADKEPQPGPEVGHEGQLLVPSAGASSAPRVLTAAESHAGMLDPWSEAEEPRKPPRPPPATSREKPPAEFEDEVVTSAGPSAAIDGLPGESTHAQVPSAPEPAPFPADEAGTKPNQQGEPPGAPVDLAGLEAFADLPDDARDTFARAASVGKIARGGHTRDFALALVVLGSVDVVACGVGAPVMRILSGSVLRARGTLEATIPLELVCTSEFAVIATWDSESVAAAFRTCPWVEDDLCAAGDRVQALAGVTLGSLGKNLNDDLRAILADRLTLRALSEHEVLTPKGDPVPGVLIVGAGTVELVVDNAVSRELAAGDFVFPAETLSAGRASATARAGKAGALVLAGDRRTTQELFVTQPMLLELVAGM